MYCAFRTELGPTLGTKFAVKSRRAQATSVYWIAVYIVVVHSFTRRVAIIVFLMVQRIALAESTAVNSPCAPRANVFTIFTVKARQAETLPAGRITASSVSAMTQPPAVLAVVPERTFLKIQFNENIW